MDIVIVDLIDMNVKKIVYSFQWLNICKTHWQWPIILLNTNPNKKNKNKNGTMVL